MFFHRSRISLEVHRITMAVTLGAWALSSCSGDAVSGPLAGSTNEPAIIEIGLSTLRLLVGNTFEFTADVRTADGRPAVGTVQWSSNAMSVASVDAVGRVEALSAGQAFITATAGTISAQVTVTVPAPVGEITQGGGLVESSDRHVQLILPENSLSTPTTISVVGALADSIPPGTEVVAGTTFEFGPAGLQFNRPATLSIEYDPARVSGSEEIRLILHKLVGSDWVPVTGCTVDVEARTVTGEISSFSIYGIVPGPNQPPLVRITGPADDSEHDLASVVEFVGIGLDAEDGTLSGENLVWASSVDGELGTGSQVVRSDLSLGSHDVTLTATDSDGAQGSESVSLMIVDPPPTAQITEPADGTVVKVGEPVTLAGSGSDPVDGSLTGSSLSWSSSADGLIGTGVSVTTSSLSPATHVISLAATNSRGGTAVASISLTVVPNASPSATITSPGAGAVYTQGDVVQFHGSASDPEDGVLTGTALVWSSSLNGQLGAGTSFQRTDLSVGQHLITLVATDSDGAWGNTSVSIRVNGVPAVQISAPVNGTAVDFGTSIGFAGTATDPEEGTLTGSALVWRSSRNGQIGTGVGFSLSTAYLSLGDHNITLTATDSDGGRGLASISISVRLPAPILLAPASQAVLDNGCFPESDSIVWDFDWADITGVTRYHLFVMGETAIIPVINATTISESAYHHESTGHIIERHRHGWRWRVRANAQGVWGPWSEERFFDTEPVNTDCGGG